MTQSSHQPSLFPISPDAPWLAPLAGFSDLPFRLLCRSLGAAVACTEMVSAKGLVFSLRQKYKTVQLPLSYRIAPPDPTITLTSEDIDTHSQFAALPSGTEDLLTTTDGDAPLIVQLFGAEPEYMESATEHLRLSGFCWFDVNMGCSVPKVTKTGAGSAMLKNPQNAIRVVKKMVNAAGAGRVGCKLRLGWQAGEEVYIELAKALQDVGAAWITLHPRYAKQHFTGQAEYRALAALCKAIEIPVIASGDLFTAEDAIRCIQETGVHSIMFARGAMNNPAIFANYHALRHNQPYQPFLPPEMLRSQIIRHAILAKQLTPGKPGRRGFSPALLKMRTVVPRYIHHLHGSKQLRMALSQCESWSHFSDIITDFFSNLPPDMSHQEPLPCTS